MPSRLTHPLRGWGAPKDRTPIPPRDLGLPAGTEVFSADNHISLSEDIFFERAPASMRDRVPRVMRVNGAWSVAVDGASILVPQFLEVLTQYDPLPGSHTGDVDARLAALDAEGVDKELAFPNAILALFGWPDKEVREVCFRIYNEHIAGVQERSGGRIFGVALISWWDAEAARRTLQEAKALGLRTFLLPLHPGRNDDKSPIDYASTAMDDVWAAIEESQLPVSHHIGESPPATPNQFNAIEIGMLQSVAPFRDTFGKYVFGGILDRHPRLRIGFFEGGINWVASVIQDAEHLAASFHHINDYEPQHGPRHYWEHHMMSSFIVDPLGLELVDRIGIDRVMWSTDFPHNESTFGYTTESLSAVVEAVGAERAPAVVGGNVSRYLGLETAVPHQEPAP
jgi:predicted TIM-barrel fold metal-dependent hydrolase